MGLLWQGVTQGTESPSPVWVSPVERARVPYGFTSRARHPSGSSWDPALGKVSFPSLEVTAVQQEWKFTFRDSLVLCIARKIWRKKAVPGLAGPPQLLFQV